MDGNRTIVWFRRDLRIEDNHALAAAARDGSVCPIYIWCPKEEGQFYPGRVSRWWLKESLVHLGHSLKSLGAELILIKTDNTLSSLLDCVNAIGAARVVFNHLYDPVSLLRDHMIKEKLVELGISVQSYNGDLLNEPWEIYDERGEAFTTFDSYWGKCLQSQMEPVACLPPWRLVPASGDLKKCTIEELDLEDESERASNSLLGRAWSPGWGNADKVLTEFVEHHLINYSKNRLRVGGNSTSTSLLSPYLHFGEVSVRKVFHSVRIKQLIWAKEENAEAQESVNLFLKSIGLRDYSRYLCFNFPFTHEKSLLGHLKYFPWNPNQAYFKAWRQGKTGYPLVDAGMRELWATGWIHNRIRVIVSSFAVKFLLLPWRWGMKYFWDTLLDADLESDILGWQYISGSLPDGHDIQRIDNPEVQGSKFDPEGEYARHWLPELARMPTEWIHHPWDAPFSVLKAAGVELGQNYPKPMIDIDSARERLQEAIFKMWEIEGAAKGSYSGGTNEVTADNTGYPSECFATTKTVFKEKASCLTISSNDQKVPTFESSKNGALPRKRSRLVEDERSRHDQLDDQNNVVGTLKTNEELSSTAESSGSKKQTNSRCSFSVPQYSFSEQECESSELKQPCQVHVDIENWSGIDEQ